MRQSIYRVLSRTDVQRVKPDTGFVYRILVPLTAILMGLLLAGGLMWWAEVAAAWIA